MTEKEILLKKIIDKFSTLELKISYHNSINLTDINIFSETFFAELLNIVYDYKLVSCKNHNQASIDLIDDKNGIAFQITSIKKKKKVQDTLNSFYAQNLYINYPILNILVMGKKQKRYENLKTYSEFEFNSNSNILDFSFLIKKIKLISTPKMHKVLRLFTSELSDDEFKNSSKSLQQLNRNLNLKKKIETDLVHQLNYEERNTELYEPYVKFLYPDLIIRSVNDISFPEYDETSTFGSRSWFKCSFYNFYENGLEFQAYGGVRILMDSNGYWEVINDLNDKRISKYELKYFSEFLRVPFNYIVKYDLEIDPVYGLPSFYIKYNSKNEAFEEIVYGINGDASKKQKRILLDKNKMTVLK